MKSKVAYLVSRFPHLPETFILREMIAMEQQGVQVELFPLILQEQAVVHTDSLAWMKRLHYFKIFSVECLAANLRAVFHQPVKYFSTLFQVIGLNVRSPKFLLRAFFIFPKAVRMAEEMQTLKISHIHAHYATHPALAAYIISNLTSIPYSISVHAHDIFVDRTMLSHKIKKAAFIRAISEFNKSFLIKQYGNSIAGKIFVVHCGIEIEKYQPKMRLTGSEFKIISVGSLQAYKGHEYLIKACSVLKDMQIPYQCVIVGGGELKADLAGLVNTLGIADRVVLAGPKTEDEIADLLAQFQCFVLPSVITRSGKMEGIPVVLMEAMASRVPVIASGISGIPELVVDGITGLLVPPEDVNSLAEKIIWVKDHPGDVNKMIETGYRKVYDEFNVETNVGLLKELFAQYQKKIDGR